MEGMGEDGYQISPPVEELVAFDLIAATRVRVLDDAIPSRLNTLQGRPHYQEKLGSTKWPPWESKKERSRTHSRGIKTERVGMGGVGRGNRYCQNTL